MRFLGAELPYSVTVEIERLSLTNAVVMTSMV